MKEVIVNFLAKHINLDKELISNALEIPPDSSLGDYAFPCFVLAKVMRRSPVDIATLLAGELGAKLPKEISGTNASGPYLNFFVNKKIFLENTINQILKEKEKFGCCKQKGKVMIEFSQANTHKAFHVGHIRGTSLGESLARILEFSGNSVLRANYQGDTGMHVAKWLWDYRKYHSKEKLKEDESWVAGIYVEAVKRLAENPNFEAEVNEINRKLESREDKTLNELWAKTRKLSLDSLERIYKELGTHFDNHFFESEFEKRGKELAQELVKKNIAKISEGATIMDLKDYGLGVWVLLRSDGTVLYSAKDLALAEEKFDEYKIDKAVYVVGVEQKLHFQQLEKTLELMRFKQADKCKFVHFELVRLPTGKMSSRTGENILYSDFIKEVVSHSKKEIKKRFPKLSAKELEKRAFAIAIAAIKYSMLKQDPNRVLVFEKEQALNFEGESGPYLQYSYARASSIMRKAKSKAPGKVKVISLCEKEVELAKKLAEFPSVAEQVYAKMDPSLLANYVFKLSQVFNEFYHACPVIESSEKKQRLGVVQAFLYIQKLALGLLGIEVMEEM